MTRRHEQVSHRNRLSEIRNIMYSMKTLSIMETIKLERYLKSQSAITESIEQIATDFLHFHPHVLPEAEPVSNFVLLIGSQRGFCGDFNEQLIKKLQQYFDNSTEKETTLIAVGSKLHPLIKETHHNNVELEGADVAEEVPRVVTALATIFATQKNPASLYAIHHNNQHNDLSIEKLLPPFQELPDKKTSELTPPLLNLTSREFFLELTDHYLFNALHHILYLSLMIENKHRTLHLENATHHLDDKTDELNRKINALRQEEIIEEIEVILLNASSF